MVADDGPTTQKKNPRFTRVSNGNIGKIMGRPWIGRLQPAVGERFGMVCAFPG
jgi:hypothetical protein